jgi:RNA polymerase sigma-B factor
MAFEATDRNELRAKLEEYARSGDKDLRDEIVASQVGLAEYLARRFKNRGEPIEDLIQVALLGLLKAVERFDPGRGLEFSTFATPTIVGELKRHFRDKGWAVRVPRRVQELHLRMGTVVNTLSQELGRPTGSAPSTLPQGTTRTALPARRRPNSARTTPAWRRWSSGCSSPR